MKITLSKKEFEEMALDGLRLKYGSLAPLGMDVDIDIKYDGTAIIEFTKPLPPIEEAPETEVNHESL